MKQFKFKLEKKMLGFRNLQEKLENSSANQGYHQAGTLYTIELTDGADTSLKWHVSWIIYTFLFETNQTVGDWI